MKLRLPKAILAAMMLSCAALPATTYADGSVISVNFGRGELTTTGAAPGTLNGVDASGWQGIVGNTAAVVNGGHDLNDQNGNLVGHLVLNTPQNPWGPPNGGSSTADTLVKAVQASYLDLGSNKWVITLDAYDYLSYDAYFYMAGDNANRYSALEINGKYYQGGTDAEAAADTKWGSRVAAQTLFGVNNLVTVTGLSGTMNATHVADGTDRSTLGGLQIVDRSDAVLYTYSFAAGLDSVAAGDVLWTKDGSSASFGQALADDTKAGFGAKGTGTVDFGASRVSFSVLHAEGGAFTVMGGDMGVDRLFARTGATLEVQGNLADIRVLSIEGCGTVKLAGGVTDVDAISVSATSHLELAHAVETDIASDMTVAGCLVISGQERFSGGVTVNGDFSLSGNGALTLGQGGNLTLNGTISLNGNPIDNTYGTVNIGSDARLVKEVGAGQSLTYMGAEHSSYGSVVTNTDNLVSASSSLSGGSGNLSFADMSFTNGSTLVIGDGQTLGSAPNIAPGAAITLSVEADTTATYKYQITSGMGISHVTVGEGATLNIQAPAVHEARYNLFNRATGSSTLITLEAGADLNSSAALFGWNNYDRNSTVKAPLSNDVDMKDGSTWTISNSMWLNMTTVTMEGATIHLNSEARLWFERLTNFIKTTATATKMSVIEGEGEMMFGNAGANNVQMVIERGKFDIDSTNRADLSITAICSDDKDKTNNDNGEWKKLYKSGNGVLELTNENNDYRGGTEIQDGTLKLGGAGGKAGVNAVTVNGGGVFELAHTAACTTSNAITLNGGELLVSGADETVSSVISGTTSGSKVTVSAGKKLTLTGANTSTAELVASGTAVIGDASTWAGDVTVNAGGQLEILKQSGGVASGKTVSLSGQGTLNADNTVKDAGALKLADGVTLASTIEIASGGASVAVAQGAEGTLSGAISGGVLTKVGGGTLDVSGGADLTLSRFDVSAGELKLSADATVSSLTLSGGTLSSGTGATVTTTDFHATSASSITADALTVNGMFTIDDGVTLTWGTGTALTINGSLDLVGAAELTGVTTLVFGDTSLIDLNGMDFTGDDTTRTYTLFTLAESGTYTGLTVGGLDMARVRSETLGWTAAFAYDDTGRVGTLTLTKVGGGELVHDGDGEGGAFTWTQSGGGFGDDYTQSAGTGSYVKFTDETTATLGGDIQVAGVTVAEGATLTLQSGDGGHTLNATDIYLEADATLKAAGAVDYTGMTSIDLQTGAVYHDTVADGAGFEHAVFQGTGTVELALGGTGAHTVSLGSNFNGTFKVTEGVVDMHTSDIGQGAWKFSHTDTATGGAAFADGDNFTAPLYLEGAGHGMEVASGTATISGDITGDTTSGLTKKGAGTLVLAGGVDIRSMTVEAGVLQLSGNTALHSVIVNGGTLQLNQGGTFQTLNGTGGTVTSSTSEAVLSIGVEGGSSASSYSGSIAGTLGLTILAGKDADNRNVFTLASAASYTGPTQVQSDAALKLSGSGSVATGQLTVSAKESRTASLENVNLAGQVISTWSGADAEHPDAYVRDAVITVANNVTVGISSGMVVLDNTSMSTTGTGMKLDFRGSEARFSADMTLLNGAQVTASASNVWMNEGTAGSKHKSMVYMDKKSEFTIGAFTVMGRSTLAEGATGSMSSTVDGGCIGGLGNDYMEYEDAKIIYTATGAGDLAASVKNSDVQVGNGGTLRINGSKAVEESGFTSMTLGSTTGTGEAAVVKNGVIEASRSLTVSGDVTFHGTGSELRIKADGISIGNDAASSDISSVGNGKGAIKLDSGKQLSLRNTYISGVDISTTEATGTLYVSMGEAVKATVDMGDEPASGMKALMRSCSLSNSDVIISAAGAIDAAAVSYDDFFGRTFVISLMEDVEFDGTLRLVGMENYRDVVVHWESASAPAATSDMPALVASTAIDPLVGQADYVLEGINFGTVSGPVNVWVTFSIPEPATGALSVLALAALAARRRRK